jgi:hypothetical protein
VSRGSAPLLAGGTATSSLGDTADLLAELQLLAIELVNSYPAAADGSVNERMRSHNYIRVAQAESALRAVLHAGGNAPAAVTAQLQWLAQWARDHSPDDELPWPPAASLYASTAATVTATAAAAASSGVEKAAEARHRSGVTGHVSSDVRGISSSNSSAAAGSTAVSSGAAPVPATTSTNVASSSSSSSSGASIRRQRRQGCAASCSSGVGTTAAASSNSPNRVVGKILYIAQS